MNFERTSCPLLPGFLQKTDELMRSVTSLDELILCWMSDPRHSVQFGTGIDDNEEHSLVWVQLSDGGDGETEFYVPLDEIYKAHPGTRPIEDYVSLKKRKPFPELYVDDRGFDAYMGISIEDCYDDRLCAPILTLTQALPAILAFSCSQAGEVMLKPFEPDFLFEDSPEVLDEYLSRNLLDAYFSHASVEVTAGCRPMFHQSCIIEVAKH